MVAKHMRQHPPLRAREAHRLHPAVENGPQQASHVVQDEAEITGEVFSKHGMQKAN
jgi:hypothetical protein